MSCYFRYLKDVFAEAGVSVTPANKRALDQAIHAFVSVGYKRCMPVREEDAAAGGPDCWSKVKIVLQNAHQRAKLVALLQRGAFSR